MAEPYVITGVPGETHPRLEIRKLHTQQPEQFTLFILGWTAIRDSGYPIPAVQHVEQAGIHGLPYKRWLGDPPPGQPNPTPGQWQGYCNHRSVLFPTWHRPSLLLFEQSIVEAATSLVPTLTREHPDERPRWERAARELRLPFWDWTDPSTGEEGLPMLLYSPTLTLKLPGERTSEPLDNILAHYKFNPIPEGFRTVEQKPFGRDTRLHAYYDHWGQTYRWPESAQQNPREDIEGLNNALKGRLPGAPHRGWSELTRNVAQLFGYPHDIREALHASAWDQFSNVRFESQGGWPNPPLCGSVEQPHDKLHLIVGGLGHMMNNDYSNFDPIFYLHHCNVDRIIAFWEHIYPKYYMGNDGYLAEDGTRKPFTQPRGKFGEPAPQNVQGSSNLTPFRRARDTYWNSDDTRALRGMNYTYPPITHPSDPEIRVILGQEVTPEIRERQRAVLQKHFKHDLVQIRQKFPWTISQKRPFSEFPAEPDGDYEKVHDFRQFVIVVQLDPFAFGGSYTVEIHYSLRNGTGGYVGSAAVLGRGADTECEGCQGRRQAGAQDNVVVLVPHDIVINILESWPEHESANALIKAFHARISLPGGVVVGRSTRSPGDAEPMKEELIPALRLFSASVKARKDDTRPHDPNVPQNVPPLTPYETYDWRGHDELEGQWVQEL